MPGGGIAVLDYVVTHPAAASYVRIHAPGALLDPQLDLAGMRKRRAFDRLGDGAGLAFVPLAVHSFDAVCFPNDLGDVAAADSRASRDALVRSALSMCSPSFLVFSSAFLLPFRFAVTQVLVNNGVALLSRATIACIIMF